MARTGRPKGTNNKDIEEVIVYDQATGAKYFQWMNTRTHQPVPNLPISSELTIDKFSDVFGSSIITESESSFSKATPSL